MRLVVAVRGHSVVDAFPDSADYRVLFYPP